MVLKRWQDWINLILGLCTFISPWVYGFAVGTNPAAQTLWILGAAIVAFAGFAVYMHKAWEEVVNILLGIGLIVAPWIVGFADQSTPTSIAVIAGVLVTVFAVWAMLKETAVQKWWHERHPTR